MNHSFFPTYLLLAFMAFALSGCDWGGPGDASQDNEDGAATEIDSTAQDVGQEAIKEVEIPKDEERESNLQKAAAISPFAALGCCNDQANYGAECCCDAVIETYKTMVAANDTAIARLKMTDPILSSCRKKNQATFDKIDNPEEDYDDMVQVSPESHPGV